MILTDEIAVFLSIALQYVTENMIYLVTYNMDITHFMDKHLTWMDLVHLLDFPFFIGHTTDC